MNRSMLGKIRRTPPQLPAAEMALACEGFTAAFRDLPSSLSEAASTCLEMILPPHWALEWSLPYWLGKTFKLSNETTRHLVLSNVFGLAYIRRQDVFIDGDASPHAGPAPLLSTILYHRWLQEYIGLLGGNSQFWSCFDRYLIQWAKATLEGNTAPVHGFGTYTEEEFLRLAHRGAPLKVCCAATALLSGREDLIHALEMTLDYLLIAAVLVDHAQDWADDLATGRYNAFIAYASPWPQTPDQQEANRMMVLEELYIGRQARPYFGVVRRYLHQAARLARPLGCVGLNQYLHWLDVQAAAYGRRFSAVTQARLHRITQGLLRVSPAQTPSTHSEKE
jgi:hypothetical protein